MISPQNKTDTHEASFIGSGKKAQKPVMSKKTEKQEDYLANIVFESTLTLGYQKLNVLVIGSTKGLSSVITAGANAYFFTGVEHSRHRWKPIDRLPDYKSILMGVFDVVISREYNEDYMSFLQPNGLYISKVIDTAKVEKVLCNPTTGCIVQAKFMYGKDVQTHFGLIEKLKGFLLKLAQDDERKTAYIPDIDRIQNLSIKDEITVTHKGVKTSPYTMGLLEVMNKSLNIYNPLFTTYTGLVDAFHRFPSTAFVDFDTRMTNLKDLGFKVKESPTAREFSARIKKKYEFLTTPIMPLLPQQALAYVKEGNFTARAAVPRLGIKKGREYPIRVGWKRRRDGKALRGFMTVTVNKHVLFEDSQEDVSDYITAFGFPKVGSVETDYPDIFNLWKGKTLKMFPDLIDFQLNDVALSASKPTVYLAHDRGMGKTFMAAAWAKVRGYRRVLLTAQRQYLDKWASELTKFGFKHEWLITWDAVMKLKARIQAGYKTDETVFYLSSFEFLGLESDIKMDPWTCIEKDSSGYIDAVVENIKTPKCPSCGKTVGQSRKCCPHCGSKDYSGRYCNTCGTPTYTFIRSKPLTPAKCKEVEKQAEAGRHDFHSGTYPAYKKLKKLFKCMLIDEAQDVKNKNTIRSTAIRSMHAKGRLLITANLMKNYPNELFWPTSWLLGFNNPMFPYGYKGGFPSFERQFGTQFLKGIIPGDKENKEVWVKIPEVSNLTILWKLMAPFMVRRLKSDIEGAPEPDVEAVRLDMDDDQRHLYLNIRQSKLDELSQELLKANPDARIIGANLWSLKAATTIPSASRYFPQIATSYTGHGVKMDYLLEKVKEIQKLKEKILVFSTLVDMTSAVSDAFRASGISHIRVKQGMKNRFDVIKKFNEDDTTACVSSTALMGRCYDIENASWVIFTDVGWTPEEHEQAIDRAVRILLSLKGVKVLFLLNKGTIDEHMYELVLQKGEAIKNVLDRRAVYQPADILRDAVSIQEKVARRILGERLDELRKPAAPAKPKTIEIVLSEFEWKPVTPIASAEQLNLFGGAAPAIRHKKAA